VGQKLHFTVVEPTPHSCDSHNQIRRCRLPLRSAPTKDGQCLEDNEIDENDAVALGGGRAARSRRRGGLRMNQRLTDWLGRLSRLILLAQLDTKGRCCCREAA
jgi:hypothetical protein